MHSAAGPDRNPGECILIHRYGESVITRYGESVVTRGTTHLRNPQRPEVPGKCGAFPVILEDPVGDPKQGDSLPRQSVALDSVSLKGGSVTMEPATVKLDRNPLTPPQDIYLIARQRLVGLRPLEPVLPTEHSELGLKPRSYFAGVRSPKVHQFEQIDPAAPASSELPALRQTVLREKAGPPRLQEYPPELPPLQPGREVEQNLPERAYGDRSDQCRRGPGH